MGRRPRSDSFEYSQQYEDIVKEIGERIREYRNKKGWTQHQMAERMEKAQPYIWELESGGANPSVRMLAFIADTLGIELRELMPEGTQSVPSALALEQQKTFLEQLDTLLTEWRAQSERQAARDAERAADHLAAISRLIIEVRRMPGMRHLVREEFQSPPPRTRRRR